MLRVLFASFLSVLLCLTSVTAAIAHAESLGATEVIVCSGDGPTTVMLDAQGRPVPGHQHCPDCTLAAAALPPAPLLTPPHTLLQGKDRAIERSQVRAGAAPAILRARGPPAAL